MFLQFYGLKEQPFGVTPDPRFLYLGPGHQEALASLVYGIETGRGFMALIAPPGLGKTTLIMRLMDRLQDSALTAFLFQAHTDSRELLKNLLLDLEAEPSGEDLSDLQAQLHDLLIRSSGTGKRIVVLIDEAQNLDDSVLEMVRMLSNFETPEAKLLQIVLVGQPALADKLAKPQLAQLRQRISIITHFPLLRGDEVEKYIQHRLRVAGYKGGRLFAPDALALIARYSRGVPRVINNLCFHALSLGYAKNQKSIDVSTLGEVIADLNLESLGQGRRDAAAPARQRTAAVGTAPGGPERSAAKLENAEVGADVGAFPPVRGSDLLDRVDFSDYAPDWTGGSGNNPWYTAPARTPRRNSNRGATALATLAIVAVAILAWRAPWLGRSLDFIEQEARGATYVKAASKELRAVVPPGGESPARAPQIEEPPRGSTPPRATGTDLNSRAQEATRTPIFDAPGSTSLASPGTLPGDANPGRAPDAQAQTTDTANPHGANTRAGARRHSFARRKTDEIASGGQAVNRRNKLREGTASSVDDLGAQGVRGKLVVQSNVRGSRISINGRDDSSWVTPHMFSLAAGTYIVSVAMQGYSTWTQRVHVDEGRDKWLEAELTSNETGVFAVVTEPPGMQVYIDGQPYGASRVETVLPAGWHTCKVIPPPGIKPLEGRFHLDAGEALTKRIRLKTRDGSPVPTTQAQRAGTP
ncbi:MAG: AAA family ATPase [Terriglobia bacterium]|jgi:general secretion pathway protein A